jgi:hypothetical protein
VISLLSSGVPDLEFMSLTIQLELSLGESSADCCGLIGAIGILTPSRDKTGFSYTVVAQKNEF